MFEEYRSGSDSLSSSDNIQEVRNKWHSAEDVRNRKVRHSIMFIYSLYFFCSVEIFFYCPLKIKSNIFIEFKSDLIEIRFEPSRKRNQMRGLQQIRIAKHRPWFMCMLTTTHSPIMNCRNQNKASMLTSIKLFWKTNIFEW